MRWMLLCFTFTLASCGDQQPVRDDKITLEIPSDQAKQSMSIDAQALIGKSKQAVDAEFGTPECPPKNACVYGENFEIFYVNGIAANLTLPPVRDLKSYGLEVGKPAFENPQIGLLVWDTVIKGRKAEIRKFENYIYVKTAEPY